MKTYLMLAIIYIHKNKIRIARHYTTYRCIQGSLIHIKSQRSLPQASVSGATLGSAVVL
jgi:hypothetical protein